MALKEPAYENMIQERDVMVRMHDGVHLSSGKMVTHSVYHNAEFPSHLLLPVIPLVSHP